MFYGAASGREIVKGYSCFLDIYFPKTHDLDRIRELIPDGWKVKEKFPELYDLSIWAVESRYPGHMPDVVEHEARETLHFAEAVFDAVSEELEERIRQLDNQ